MENLAKAVIKVMQAVKGLEKNSRVGVGNAAYDGTKDKDVKEAFNEALADAGLCILPIEINETTDVNRWEQEDFYNGKSKGIKQKQSILTKVSTKYLLLHESGESMELAGYGHGIDSQDKSAGKATTYALKNCLLYTFLTPVGKIDDTDTTHSNDIATAPPKKAPAKRLPLSPADSEIWEGAVEYLKAGKVTIEKIEKKYILSPENREQLLTESI